MHEVSCLKNLPVVLFVKISDQYVVCADLKFPKKIFMAPESILLVAKFCCKPSSLGNSTSVKLCLVLSNQGSSSVTQSFHADIEYAHNN